MIHVSQCCVCRSSHFDDLLVNLSIIKLINIDFYWSSFSLAFVYWALEYNMQSNTVEILMYGVCLFVLLLHVAYVIRVACWCSWWFSSRVVHGCLSNGQEKSCYCCKCKPCCVYLIISAGSPQYTCTNSCIIAVHTRKKWKQKYLPHTYHDKSKGWTARKTEQEQHGSKKHAERIGIQSRAVN